MTQLTYSDPDVRAIWDAYVEAVQPAHGAYSHELDIAQAARDDIEQQITARTRTDRHAAWETHTERVMSAWWRYMDETRFARKAREDALKTLADQRGLPYEPTKPETDHLAEVLDAVEPSQ